MRDWNALHDEAKRTYDLSTGRPLPPLHGSSADLELIAAMSNRWSVVESAETEAAGAYANAKARRFAAIGDIEQHWNMAFHERERLRKLQTTRVGLRCADEWESRLGLLRHALMVRDHYVEHIKAYEQMTDAEREQACLQSNIQASIREQRKNLTHLQATAPAEQFNARVFLADLGRRGLSVSMHGDRLKAGPPALLRAEDRDTLRRFKADIVAALGDHETF